MSVPLFSRRRALQTLAAIPALLPLARTLHAADRMPLKRLLIVMQNNGTQQANFWPDANFRSPILDSLFSDPKTQKDNGLAAKTILVKGVYVPNVATNAIANEHDIGFARMFTGEQLVGRGFRPWGGGPSVDQLLAREWGTESLTLAVVASELEPRPKPGFDHRESFCYLGPATLKHPRTDPRGVYEYLFPSVGAPPTPQRLKLRQSVLDAASASMAEVSARLGPAERTKLDYHLTAIRDLERKIGASPCATRTAPPPDYRAIDPFALVSRETYVTSMIDNMIDLAVMGLACGATRIATLQFGYGGGKWKFGWKGIGMNCHEDVAHLDTSDDGSTPENTQRVVSMNQYYANCVARLATQLDAIPEGNGTMLDNTLVVWANEIGRGNHSLQNIPIVFIGGGAAGMPSGRRLIDEGRQPFNRLGCTILNVMGKPVAGFGDLPECGVFAGL